MNHIQVLDCSLRDGAYVVDKFFGSLFMQGMLKGLVEANLDVIEIGFFQDDELGQGKPVFLNSEQTLPFLREYKDTNCIFCVFAAFSRYSISNLDDCCEGGISLIRVGFTKEERYAVIDYCKIIKEKGYLLSVQPVDILGYSSEELHELILMVNALEPYCFSIVDTYGSMYEEDLNLVFSQVHSNLNQKSKIGFHSHNNLQMSVSLSQSFARMTENLREAVIDTTILGLGRGAGNAPTELLLRYLQHKFNYDYHLEIIFDLIDTYVEPLKRKATWGYHASLFLAGIYNTHVNNISYLKEKSSMDSNTLRLILEKVDGDKRKQYDYSLLESLYMEHFSVNFDDTLCFSNLKENLGGQGVLILVPGTSIEKQKEKIFSLIEKENPKIIAVNFVPNHIPVDYIYINNKSRYLTWRKTLDAFAGKKIFCSNLLEFAKEDDAVIAFSRVLEQGWKNIDNSAILLLRLLGQLGCQNVSIAGMDGFSGDKTDNYYNEDMELFLSQEQANHINQEIEKMLQDFLAKTKTVKISFVTSTMFQSCVDQSKKKCVSSRFY